MLKHQQSDSNATIEVGELVRHCRMENRWTNPFRSISVERELLFGKFSLYSDVHLLCVVHCADRNARLHV